MQHRFWSRTILTALLLSVCVSATTADEPVLRTETRSIAAFKNGLGFFVRAGEATLSDGWAVSEVVPPAALGTFWVGSPKPGVTIERLVARQEEVSRTVPAVSIPEIIAANIGRNARVMIGEEVIEGRITAVPEDRRPDPDRPTYPSYTKTMPSAGAVVALIQTPAGNTVAINKNAVNWIEVKGKAGTGHVVKEKVKRMRFKVAGAREKAPVTIAYLQKGFSWAPGYLIELQDEKTARLTMQGLLVNDVEDIDGADVYFVVGYPNFMFADTISPLALTQSVSQFVEGLQRSPGKRSSRGVARQLFAGANIATYELPSSELAEFGYSGTKGTPGAPEEDLFLYRVKDVALARGERAYYTVFSGEVPYEHVYEWVVPDMSNVQPSGRLDSSRRTEEETLEDQVWHKLKLTNKTEYPWTTAPAMAMSNGQPISQDVLRYTAKEASGDVRVTVATDIRGTKTEQEKSREPDALRIHGTVFAKVTAEGKLTLKNFKPKAVTVNVKKTVVGEVVSASDGGKVEKAAEGIRAVNPTSIITWEVPLEPGEEKTLDYTYFTYVRY